MSTILDSFKSADRQLFEHLRAIHSDKQQTLEISLLLIDLVQALQVRLTDPCPEPTVTLNQEWKEISILWVMPNKHHLMMVSSPNPKASGCHLTTNGKGEVFALTDKTKLGKLVRFFLMME